MTEESPQVPTSEVGSEGPSPEETGKKETEGSPAAFLTGMEALLTRLLAASQTPTANPSIPTLIKFDPDDVELDIEGWCKVCEMIVTSKKLEGADLLIALTQALKGRASNVLTLLDVSQLTWPRVKEILLAKFSRPMQPQDYFDNILRFQMTTKETACEAAMRLWSAVERIPRVEMPEDIITGFVTSVLCQKDALVRRELNSQIVTSRAQVCRVLSGISTKRRQDGNDHEFEPKRFRSNEPRLFKGTCHSCGVPGHKQADCNRRRGDRNMPKLKEDSRKTSPNCYACGNPGHLSSACPRRMSSSSSTDGSTAVKEVHICECSHARSSLSTSLGETVSFLFDSGSACSLIKASLVKKFPGISHSKKVVLLGVGRGKLLCDSQILSPVSVQGIKLSVLFHIVPDDATSESVILGRDILEDGVHVQMTNQNIIFSDL